MVSGNRLRQLNETPDFSLSLHYKLIHWYSVKEDWVVSFTNTGVAIMRGRFTALVFCGLLLLVDVLVIAKQEKSKSDRIAEMVKGSLSKTHKKSTSKKLDESDLRRTEIEKMQKLVTKATKFTKPIDSYAEQKAKAMKIRAVAKSQKQGLRRIG